jgi:nitroreductase
MEFFRGETFSNESLQAPAARTVSYCDLARRAACSDELSDTRDCQRGTGRSPISSPAGKLDPPRRPLFLAPGVHAQKHSRSGSRADKKYFSPLAKRDADLDRVWSDWLPYGGFHFATKDFEYIDAPVSFYQRYLAASPQPALLKTYGKAHRIQLPRVHVPMKGEPDSEFERVLLARKTHRDFSRKQVPLNTISTLLHHTWGVTGKIDAPPFGSAKVAKKAALYAAQQEFVADASAVFIMTAVFPRVLWKYRFARSYRVVLLDAGHLCQTFCLVATWLGLAPFCTAAIKDTLIEKDLGLDGIRESVLYMAAVGTQAGRLRSRR